MLGDLAVADVPDSRQSFAERLAQWLGFTDALALFPALGADAANVAAGRSAAPGGADIRKEFARVHAALVGSITADREPEPGHARPDLPTAAPGAALEGGADFSPWHRLYLAHQRDMNASIAPLRTKVRAALSRQSPSLKRLAAVDAVLDQALAARERKLLATVPSLLARRFARLYEAHRAAQAEAQAADEPARWMQPGGWLAVFRSEMQTVLLAELEARLQPITGLIEALGNEESTRQ